VSAGDAVLVDTGPLVARFDPSERLHGRCREEFRRLRHRRRVTSLAVITEATYLLTFSARAQRALLKWVAAGGLEIAGMTPADVSRAVDLMERYERLPMDFADATLVVLAERLGSETIFTLDRRDFAIYRVGRRGFRVIPGT
jgi:predicted nucleic acid-binding protein